jgi:hypothetical protein
LDLTDVATGWTELAATPNKAQVHVFAALRQERGRLPFALLGIDSDNGSEFINHELVRYCEQEQLTFTRGRGGRKDDNPFVEEKNWSAVRRLVGYGRYNTKEQVASLNAVYQVYRLYFNHFLPVTKLLKTEHHGSRIKKIYAAPKTPYQRVLDSPAVSEKVKAQLRREQSQLDGVQLKRELDQRLAELKPSPRWPHSYVTPRKSFRPHFLMKLRKCLFARSYWLVYNRRCPAYAARRVDPTRHNCRDCPALENGAHPRR